MARRSQAGGWRLRPHPRTGIFGVRFRHAGRRYEKSTGTRDPRLAATEAARIYSEIVSGRVAPRQVSAHLDETVAAYLADFELTNSKAWAAVVTIYFRAHILPFFGSFEAFTPATYGDYMRARIQEVTRVTVRKEISALRQFRAWLLDHGIELPPVPSVPKHGHAGKRHKQARKRKATIVTPEEVSAILAAMPERNKRNGVPVRALFTVLWETGLRPTTVVSLEAPLHYRKGADHLFITREIDKEGFERKVHLSPKARAALDFAVSGPPPGPPAVSPSPSPSPPSGKIFDTPPGTLRKYLAPAVDKAGLTDRNISVYDLKYSRISLGANTPGVPLAGLAHMVGHKHISTTALYVQTGEAAAQTALAVMAASGAPAGGPIGGPNRRPRGRPSENRGAKAGT